jgi:hypothetical protein
MKLSDLPNDVLVNHIIPYTYSPQNRELLQDIRNFKTDLDFTESVYMTIYNEFILLHDLIKFCNNKKYPVFNIDVKFENILKRGFMLRCMSEPVLTYHIFQHYHRNMNTNIMRKIRLLWGLLLPGQRSRFINNHILEE